MPDTETLHISIEVGAVRIRWELHTEFVTWTFTKAIAPDSDGKREMGAAIDSLPHEWLVALPGQSIGAMHLWVLPEEAYPKVPTINRLLSLGTLVGSKVSAGQAEVYSDLVLHADGYSRAVVFVKQIDERSIGRLVQQLIEIDTYRMMALLGLPVARQAAEGLRAAEGELAALATAIRGAGIDEEPQLLDRLTRLAAQVESHYASTHARFSASAAYFELVDRRIVDIDEQRLANLQTFGDFMGRRLSPARATCAWAGRRQEALSGRVSRVSNLLRTRVEIQQQQSSKELLTAMNRRQGLQLQIQAAVEGLSVAAITYYIAGLVSYLAKGGQKIGWPFQAETTTALAIPAIALGVWWSMRRMHRRLFRE